MTQGSLKVVHLRTLPPKLKHTAAQPEHEGRVSAAGSDQLTGTHCAAAAAAWAACQVACMEQTQRGNCAGTLHCPSGCFCAALHSLLEGLLSIVSKVVLDLVADEALVLVLQDLHSTPQHGVEMTPSHKCVFVCASISAKVAGVFAPAACLSAQQSLCSSS